jgi:hypothetical protein
VLQNRSLDVFRTVHPTIHGHSYQKAKKKRDNHSHEEVDLTTAYSAESNSVHESIDSCPDSPAPSIDAESGEENDSLTNSEREEDILSLPSRIDSIWAPRS